MSSLALYQSHGKPRPPAKGSFPIDHLGECTDVKKKYLACLSRRQQVAPRADAEGASTSLSEAAERKWDHLPCRRYAQEYLQCRMQHNLMAAEDMTALGFKNGQPDETGDPRPQDEFRRPPSPESCGKPPALQVTPSSLTAPAPSLRSPGLTLSRGLLPRRDDRSRTTSEVSCSGIEGKSARASAPGAEAEEQPKKREKKTRVKTKEDEGFVAGCGAIRPYTERGFFGRIFARYSWSGDFFKALYVNVGGALRSSDR
ncbi:COX19 cytochrome c oxidase assembly family protein [Toxoplasma gondii VAND]|uniref:COX19 cytochrome c oxidase assembly family protein n=1 Tax=Toxoplasma gondii VAND TaxID=933077 RepID=A0A086Q232_TOXGO|nr:COX19 cytochrome c oxidase assembly family protein [Toxoplasma gondii VAND]